MSSYLDLRVEMRCQPSPVAEVSQRASRLTVRGRWAWHYRPVAGRCLRRDVWVLLR
jgi:hypothetical protein